MSTHPTQITFKKKSLKKDTLRRIDVDYIFVPANYVSVYFCLPLNLKLASIIIIFFIIIIIIYHYHRN